MNEEQIQGIIKRAEEMLATDFTKEEAVNILKDAGILDENGELPPHYQNLPYAFEIFPNRYK